MELQLINNTVTIPEAEIIEISSDKPFMQANTIESTLEEVKHQHIIPVFHKDNEPVISHSDFIETCLSAVHEAYSGETILAPNIRLSHPIKGRIPEAKNKPANELLEHEKTIYYERMAFIIEIPSICDTIDGNRLSLTVGGVKALNLDNLYSKKGSDEHFKIFVGFKNTVCTNLCVWTDGFMQDLKVSSIGQLKGAINVLLRNYNENFHLTCMKALTEYSISEQQFASIIGKCRMYQYLPKQMQNEITPLFLGDNQMGSVVRDFYRDDSFCKTEDDRISLWRLYNLLTGSNKSSYIDSFVDRAVNTYQFVEHLRWGLEGKTNCWYLT